MLLAKSWKEQAMVLGWDEALHHDRAANGIAERKLVSLWP